MENEITRKEFLNKTGGAVVAVVLSGAAISSIDGCSKGDTMKRDLKLVKLDDALGELAKIEKAGPGIKISGTWSLGKILVHCAQSIEYSITGYPDNKPAFIRKTIGKIILNKFMGQGYMSHGTNEPVAGAPEISNTVSDKEGFARLRKAIADFQNFKGETKIHLMFDAMSKEEYDKYHSMHIANHLSMVALT